MYRRSLQPRWREIAASVFVIAILLPPLGFLAGDRQAPGDLYWDELQGDALHSIDLVRYGEFSSIHAGVQADFL